MQKSRLQSIEEQLKKLSHKVKCGTQFYDTFGDFPSPGVPCALYVDKSTGAVYVFDEDTSTYISADSGLTPELSGGGLATQVAFWDSPTSLSGSNNLFWDNTSSRLGINNPTPLFSLDVNGLSRLNNTTFISPVSNIDTYTPYSTLNIVNNGAASFAIDRFSTNVTPPHMNLRKSRGLTTAPTSIQTGDELGFIGFWGHDGTAFQRNAIILANASSVSGGLITPILRFGLGTSTGANFYRLRIENNGDIVTGDFTPLARFHVRSSGTTSATTALLVQNSTPSELFKVTDDGTTYFGNVLSNVGTLGFNSNLAAIAGNYIILQNNNVNITTTSSITNHIIARSTYAPTSGTGVFNNLSLQYTINQTGGANGITRGLYVNPTLTAAADWRAIETSNGKWLLTDTYSAGSGSLAGSSLEVNATWNTTGTPSLIKANVTDTASNAGSLLMDLRVGNAIRFQVAKGSVGGFAVFSSIGTGVGVKSDANLLNLTSGQAGTSSGDDFSFGSAQGPRSNTSGTHNVITIRGGVSQGITPTSGTAVFNIINIPTTINQTGGANGITRGLYINPTLTAAADWRGLEINTPTKSTIYAGRNTGSAALQIDSTVQGFLPPRVTTTERNAIVTPAAGLVIFNTTTTKLECYDGAVWQAAW